MKVIIFSSTKVITVKKRHLTTFIVPIQLLTLVYVNIYTIKEFLLPLDVCGIITYLL